MSSVNSRTFSRVTIKRACFQAMMGINEKCEKNLTSQFFSEILNYSSFLKQLLLSNKIPSSSTAADNPFASSIPPKRQARQVDLIFLYLYNNAATIYFSHHLQYIYSPTNKYIL